jgi:hypothetical protein
METTVAAVYCEGWDDDNGVVNPLTHDQAESRDSAGEPYSVVLLAGGGLHSVLDICWAEGYFAVTRFDAEGRKVAAHELRRAPEGDLFLRLTTTWSGPPGVVRGEFPRVAARHRTTWQIGSGRRTDLIEPAGDGGGRHVLTDLGRTPPRLPIPSFGRWKALLDRTARVHAEICASDYRDACAIPLETGGPFRIVDAEAHDLPVSTSGERPWHPPRPRRPRGVNDLFRNGAEGSADGRRMIISTHSAGKLNLPSGRLVAADPSGLDAGQEPFVTTVPPGTYPVTVSLATFTDDPEHPFVAAARLDVADRRPVTWEPALRDEQDLLDLGYGEFFGFPVETGTACFVDEDNRERLSGQADDLKLRGRRFTNHADGDLIAWSSGWGDGYYPTWIGRDHSGRVVAFVADMLLFDPDD